MAEMTKVDADALAFGIQFTMQFPENRSLAFSTAAAQSIEPAEMRALLLKMSDAADYLDNIYRLRAMRVHLERQENELATCRQQRSNIEVRHAQQFSEMGRKGDFKPNGAQRAEYNNLETSEKRYIEMISKIRQEIKDLEKRTAG